MTRFNTGENAYNVIPDVVKLGATYRSLTHEGMVRMKKRMYEVGAGLCKYHIYWTDMKLVASTRQLCFTCSSYYMLDKVVLVCGMQPQYTAGQCKGQHCPAVSSQQCTFTCMQQN